jgi:hypothetical protein
MSNYTIDQRRAECKFGPCGPFAEEKSSPTIREREIQETSEILHISDSTVEFHAFNACHKLGDLTRAQAAAIALREGIIRALSVLRAPFFSGRRTHSQCIPRYFST